MSAISNSLTNQSIPAFDDFLASLGPSAPPETFLERANVMLARDIPIIPLLPKSKDPCTRHAAYDATSDPDVIDKWAIQYDPTSNCAAVASFDAFWMVDDDRGTLAAKYKADTGQDLPSTFSVKTSRGFHYYFLHDAASRMIRYDGHDNSGVIDIPDYKGEARCNRQYVVAPGSIHPSGALYEICNDAPIVAAPVQLLEWLQKAYALSESLKIKSKKPKSNRKADPGFNKVFDAIGYQPLVRRINALPNAQLHLHHGLQRGKVVPCPMPHHKHADYSDCFGPMQDVPEVLHCLGNCGWSGDMVAAVYQLDGGKKKYRSMYDCARVICEEESLNFEDFFSEKPTAEPSVESDTSPTEKETASENTVSAPVSGTADQIIPKKIVWLWPNRIAQKLNMLVGNPDLGKGLITYYIIACITTGRDWFDGKNTIPPSEVLIMSGEEDWDDTIVPRLMAAGADLSKVRWLKMSATKDGKTTEKELQLDRDAAALETFLTEHPNIRLVVVDPISNYLGSAKMIDEQRVREVLTPLKDIANRRHVAIIGVMHLNKKVELDAIHRIGGAMAFVGVARMVWLVAPKSVEDGTESDELLMVKLKGNIVHRQLKGLSYTVRVHYVPIEGDDVAAPYVDWIGEVNQNANELIGKPPKPAHRPAEQLPACVDWLREYLKDGAVLLDEVVSDGKALHGFGRATIERARKPAGVVTFPSGKTKARDGKMRNQYSCRLNAQATVQHTEGD